MNRRMKRLAVVLMAAAVPLLFAACGDSKKGSAGTGASGSAASASGSGGTGVAAVGFNTCFKCHADNNMPMPHGHLPAPLATIQMTGGGEY